MPRHPNLLDRNKTALVIVDVQTRLSSIMEKRQAVLDNLAKLIKGCRILSVPVFFTEQYPKGLGRTEQPLLDLLGDVTPVEKIRFSVCQEEALMKPLTQKGLVQIVLVGMETHVCILQSALDFLHHGFRVHLPADAVCSRRESDHHHGLKRMAGQGVTITSTEAVLFELAETAGTAEFKQISQLVK